MLTLKLSKPTLIALPLVVLGLFVPLTHAQTIDGASWFGFVRNGTDPFYLGSVVEYRTGTTATLVVAFDNAAGNSPINVTRVTVLFDWGQSYNASNGVPIVLNGGVLRTFTITFTVPATSTATNVVTHSYDITVFFNNLAGTNPRTDTRPGSNFAVLSNDQADAMNTMQRLGGPVTTGYQFPTFRTAQASALAAQATSEANLGQSLYASGDFTNAKTHLANASNLLGNATSNEQSKSAAFDLSIIVAGWGGLLLGIGASIIGVAAMIYALKRHRTASYAPSPSPSTSR